MTRQREPEESLSQLADELIELVSKLDVLESEKSICDSNFIKACKSGTREEKLAAGIKLIRANVELARAINRRDALGYKLAQLSLEGLKDAP